MRHARPLRLAGLAGDVLDLLHPRRCVGCGLLGRPLCLECSRSLAREPFRHRPSGLPGSVPCLYAAAAYDGIARTAILEWKERANRDLCRPLAHALAAAVAFGMADLGVDAPVAIVPVPASNVAVRARGEDVLGRMARLAARDLTQQGHDARPQKLLSLMRTPRDQAALGTLARRENLAGAMRARSRRAADASTVVVLVDDVATTGATLTEASRALTSAGWTPGLAATIAATSRKVYGDDRGQ